MDEKDVLVLLRYHPDTDRYAADRFLNLLYENNLSFNVILNPVFNEYDIESLRIVASALLGRYITDGNVAGICITNKGNTNRRDNVSFPSNPSEYFNKDLAHGLSLMGPHLWPHGSIAGNIKGGKKGDCHLKGLK